MMQGHGRSEADMANLDVKILATQWLELAQAIFVPHTEVEYQRLVAFLDQLIDEVGEDETHPLASLMELVGVLIERYEDDHVPELTSET
jgi:HTH-type transcriptional regulator/antitoxin HigA